MRLISMMLLIFFSYNSKATDRPVSLVFDDAPVGHILQALADFQQLNLMIAPGVKGTLSLRLQEVSSQQALQLVSRMAKLSIQTEGNVMLVYPAIGQQEEQQQEMLRDERRQQKLPLEMKRLALMYADATEVASSLKAAQTMLMTARGSITVDPRTNALLVHDIPSALMQIEKWVRALDVPLDQIELAAHIVTINVEDLQELGVSWGLSGEEQITHLLRNRQSGIDLAVKRPTVTAGFHFIRLDRQLLELELSALQRENKIEILASPHLFTSHQQPATIKQGIEIPYEVSSGTRDATTIEFKEAVLGMEVTPAVQPDGWINLKLHIFQNMPAHTLNRGDSEMLSINKQEIKTRVSLKDGQTLALGGIFQQEKTSGRNKVPLLGDVPLIGALFRHDMHQSKRRELVIFITPRLIHNN